jgi:hypothetical protein
MQVNALPENEGILEVERLPGSNHVPHPCSLTFRQRLKAMKYLLRYLVKILPSLGHRLLSLFVVKILLWLILGDDWDDWLRPPTV